MLSLNNPIPRSVDKDELTQFYKKYGIIPYYGSSESSSHTFLDLLMSLTSLSPSFTACMLDLNAYTFGRNVDIVGRAIPGLSDETTELDFSDKEAFVLFLSELNISLVQVIKMLKKVLRYIKDNGNAYIHLKRVTVGDTVKYFIKTPHYKHCAYLNPAPTERNVEFLIISKFLAHSDAEQLMVKNPPIIITSYSIW